MIAWVLSPRQRGPTRRDASPPAPPPPTPGARPSPAASPVPGPPEGMPACRRGLSEATPPAPVRDDNRTPEGCQLGQRRMPQRERPSDAHAGTPPGCEDVLGGMVRWCRSAHHRLHAGNPPACFTLLNRSLLAAHCSLPASRSPPPAPRLPLPASRFPPPASRFPLPASPAVPTIVQPTPSTARPRPFTRAQA